MQTRALFLLAPLLLTIGTPLVAQEFRATLTGTVTDPSGAVVPNASVEAVNVDTQQKYPVTTTSKGGYFIPYMLPGTYRVTVSAPGFQTQVQDKVLLDAVRSRGLDFVLKIGATTQTIEVSSVPPLIDNANGSGGTVLTEREISNLPLNGRQIYTLLGTTPGSQFAQTQFGSTGYSGTRGWDVSNNYTLGGGVQNYQQFTLNGTNITEQTGGGQGTWFIAPNVDALQQVNVMTTTYDARYGRSGGGTVNMVVKSGNNQFHGNVYDYFENGHLNANNFGNNVAGIPKSMIHQNQFGGTFGGPIKKDKIFFFGSFEGYKESIPFTVVASTVPGYLQPASSGVNFNNTAASGVTYQIFDPTTTECINAAGSLAGTIGNCNSPNHYARQMFANNTIPTSRIGPAGANLLKLYPAANTGGAALANNLVVNAPDVYSYYQPMGRVDYDTSDKTRWYSLFAFQHGKEDRNTNGLTGVAERCNCDHTRQNVTASQDMTHIFSPTLIADFKLSFVRFMDFGSGGNLSAAVNPSAIGLNMPVIPTSPGANLPEITLNGFATAVGNQITDTVWNNFVFDNDWTKTISNHTIHFGGEIAQYQIANPNSVGHPNGVFTFGSGYTQYDPQHANACPGCSSTLHDGYSVADMLLGIPDSGSIDYNKTHFDYYPTYAGYIQDDWKVTKRLTMNIGLRYDIQMGTKERHNFLNRGVCMTCINPVSNDPAFQANVAKDTAAWRAAGIDPSLIFPAYAGLVFSGVNGEPSAGYNTDWSNIQPRFGFAYQIDPKTVIRGGYGIEYSLGLEEGTFIGASIQTPYNASTNSGLTPTNNFFNGNPYPNGFNVPTGNSLGLLTNVGNQLSVDFPQRRIPRSQIFSFGIQRELPWRLVLDARYAANYTDRLRNGTASSNGGNVWLNGTMPLSQYQLAIANPNYFSQQVPNPYYGVPAFANTTRGQNPTIDAKTLRTPNSDFNLIGQANDPLGRENYNALELKVEKRVSGAGGGLNFRAAYTWSKTMQANGYTNGWPYQDAELLYQLVPTDREHVFTVTGEWALPVGKGAKFNPHGVVGQIVNDWNIAWISSVQSGFPLSISQGYDYQCNHGYRTDGGPTNTNYLYNDYTYQYKGKPSAGGCWVQNSAISPNFLNYLPQRIGQVRQPSVPSLDLTVYKNFTIRESLKLQFRADAQNLFNTPLRQNVDTNPTDGQPVYQGGVWHGFGTVNQNQYNFPRIIQLAMKLSF